MQSAGVATVVRPAVVGHVMPDSMVGLIDERWRLNLRPLGAGASVSHAVVAPMWSVLVVVAPNAVERNLALVDRGARAIDLEPTVRLVVALTIQGVDRRGRRPKF